MFSPYKKLLREQKGFTLLEVMVAITILLLVILPLSSLYVRSLTVIQNAALYSQAIQLANERMEICEVLDYGSLYYYNEILTPGFPYTNGTLPPSHRFDFYGGAMNPVAGNAYDNRDNPDTDDLESYFDPTDSNDENYPVPVYRDYYNNYTGVLLDPNFNGLCDDDLDGDGLEGILAPGGPDMEDIEIATNGRLIMYSDPVYQGTPAAGLGDTYVPGDGLFDTVVEGSYIASMDPMYRQVRITESTSPLLDMGLLLDRSHRAAVSDFRHRETAYRNFVRMTTIIDPTPRLANPNDVDTWIDQLYIRDARLAPLNLSDDQVNQLNRCLQRDLPLLWGLSNYDVGIADSGLYDTDAFNVNYQTPVYGKKIIITVFYLTGEGEVELTDIDGDGTFEEVPMETYGGARRIRLERVFYNDALLNGIIKSAPQPPRWEQSTAGNIDNPARTVLIPDVVDGTNGYDPCSFENDMIPYLQ